MASLIPKNGVLVNFADVAPSPSKDYCQIIVDNKEIIFRLWKISLRNDAKCNPTEVRDTHEDFLYDDRVQGEVHRVFGKSMLEYLKALASGQMDFLPRLSRVLLVKIICYLDLEDISRLSLTSKFFWELCRSDDVWKLIYGDHSEKPISGEMESLAEAIGWRKLFFTNKLQLQMQLRRHTASKQDSFEHQSGDSEDTAYGTPKSDLSPVEGSGDWEPEQSNRDSGRDEEEEGEDEDEDPEVKKPHQSNYRLQTDDNSQAFITES